MTSPFFSGNMSHVVSRMSNACFHRTAWSKWLFFITSMLLLACHEHHTDVPEPPEPHVSRQTVILFMPWSTNMKDLFDENIADFEKAISEGILHDDRVLACIATSVDRASIIELRMEDGKGVRDTLQTIDYPRFSNSSQITRMLNDIKAIAPARRYSMVASGHGMAWLPVDATRSFAAPPFPDRPVTRFFGGLTPLYQIEVSALAQGIADAGLHMEYILFDDCYMASVEVAYQLRHVTDHVIGCPTEVMVYGFPYHLCAKMLVGDIDYQGICDVFHQFYSNYHMPYGTVAVIDCSELERLADLAYAIHARYLSDFDPDSDIQSMDGYTPPLFLDMGDTYDHICKDSAMLASFHEQLERTVPSKSYTYTYYSAIDGRHEIRHFSGVTCSEASTNPQAIDSYKMTEWYKATH